MSIFDIEVHPKYTEKFRRSVTGEEIQIGFIEDWTYSCAIPNPNRCLVKLKVSDNFLILEEEGSLKPSSFIICKTKIIYEGELFILGNSKICIEETRPILVISVKEKKVIGRYKLDEGSYKIGNTIACSIEVNGENHIEIEIKYHEGVWKIFSDVSDLWMPVKNFRNFRPNPIVQIPNRLNEPFQVKICDNFCRITKIK